MLAARDDGRPAVTVLTISVVACHCDVATQSIERIADSLVPSTPETDGVPASTSVASPPLGRHRHRAGAAASNAAPGAGRSRHRLGRAARRGRISSVPAIRPTSATAARSPAGAPAARNSTASPFRRYRAPRSRACRGPCLTGVRPSPPPRRWQRDACPSRAIPTGQRPPSAGRSLRSHHAARATSPTAPPLRWRPARPAPAAWRIRRCAGRCPAASRRAPWPPRRWQTSPACRASAPDPRPASQGRRRSYPAGAGSAPARHRRACPSRPRCVRPRAPWPPGRAHRRAPAC